jgi:hypothetical protein
MVFRLAQALDEPDQLVSPVSLAACNRDQLFGLGPHDAFFASAAGDGNPTTSLKLEETFIAQCPKSPQHGVGIDPENCGEVARRRKSFAGLCLAVGDSTPDVTRNLIVQQRGI